MEQNNNLISDILPFLDPLHAKAVVKVQEEVSRHRAWLRFCDHAMEVDAKVSTSTNPFVNMGNTEAHRLILVAIRFVCANEDIKKREQVLREIALGIKRMQDDVHEQMLLDVENTEKKNA